MDKILVEPFQNPACTSFKLPASKSITNRALLLAAMQDYPLRINNPIKSRDGEIMLSCLKDLGYDVLVEKSYVSISGECNLKANLNVGNAGTAARFLTAFVCTKVNGVYNFDSDKAMYSRPMAGLINALKGQGAVFEFKGEKNCFPFTVKTSGLQGGEIVLDASQSSQILSAILMASPAAKADTVLRLKGKTVSEPFVKMTLKMMEDFGFCAEDLGENSYKILHGITTSPETYDVEADATAASYPIALAAVTGGAVLIEDFPFTDLQGDARFAELLSEAGIIKTKKIGKDLLVVKSEAKAKKFNFDFNAISDTFLTLAAAAPILGIEVKITGLAHTRKQECDRVLAMSTGLKNFAQNVNYGDDFIEIKPHKTKEISKHINAPILIATYEDHRVAMSFGIAASANIMPNKKGWIEILDPNCTSKTFPEFFNTLKEAKMNSEKFKIVAVDGGAAVGKSSVSKECANTLNYMHVDTGAHYRTLSYILLQNGILSDNPKAVTEFLKTLKISVYLEGRSARMSIDGKKIEDADIRNDLINANVSIFASMPDVRNFLKDFQRSMADEAKAQGFAGLVMEGRDVGTVIFPNATLKIFLDADEETRALRRKNEGISDSIAKRDKLDKTRKTAPLVCAKDAELIDTSKMTKDEVIAKALSLIIKA